MNRISRKVGMGVSGGAALGSWLSRGGWMMLAMASLVFSGASAHAACGNLSGLGLGKGTALQLPMLGQAESDSDGYVHGSNDSIVGLWHVVYTQGGALFNESLDQWHSDGTEFENAYLPVAGGNICFGVWKTVSGRTVRLHHVGWTYDPVAGGNANGTFTLDETNTVARDGKTYKGYFVFKTFDLKGNKGADMSGTLEATRITVD